MGIDGLLKFLKPVTEKEHISTFKNMTAGVDIMSWIYRGCYSCNFQLSQNVKSVKYLYYLLQMVQVLSFYNIKPIFIFDGRSFGLKNETNQKRIKQKQQNKAKAQQLMKQGKVQEARKYFSRCIFIDESIISTTMNVMHSRNIPFYVAPYEADSQIAKLKKIGAIDFAISEDSDLIAYGVNTVFKLNQNGDCDYIDISKWSPRDVDCQYLKEYLAMNFVNRLESAILAGSDYNPSINGIGIKRAVKLLYRQATMKNVINKLRNEKTYTNKIPEGYQKLIQKVKMIFLFATVYNPIKKQLEYLNPDLFQQHKLQELSEQQFMQIIGEHYAQYLQKEVHMGKTKAKDLSKREIVAQNVRQMFRVNKENMILHEVDNKKRKEEMEKLREQREQLIQKGEIKVFQMKSNQSKQEKKEISPAKTQLTEEEKEKKKLERKNRIIKLQDVMNSVVEMFDDEQKQSICQKKQDKNRNAQKKMQDAEQKVNNPFLNTLTTKLYDIQNFLTSSKQKKSESQSQISQSQMQEQEQEQEQNQQVQQSQSQSLDLGFLNPFGKTTNRSTKKTIS